MCQIKKKKQKRGTYIEEKDIRYLAELFGIGDFSPEQSEAKAIVS